MFDRNISKSILSNKAFQSYLFSWKWISRFFFNPFILRVKDLVNAKLLWVQHVVMHSLQLQQSLAKITQRKSFSFFQKMSAPEKRGETFCWFLVYSVCLLFFARCLLLFTLYLLVFARCLLLLLVARQENFLFRKSKQKSSPY